MSIVVLAEPPPPPPPGYTYVFRASYWDWRQMRRVYASEYNKKAFRLRVRIGGPRRVPPDRIGPKPGTAPKRPRVKKPRK